ncbi:MAG: hypothetical protein ABR520_07495 [Mycobacteriales bacterium]|nr:hypothetical protein [Frankia sp.]
MSGYWKRALAAMPVALVIAPFAVLSASSPAAAASGTITSPSSGTTVRSNQFVHIAAQVHFTSTDRSSVTLYLQAPDGGAAHALRTQAAPSGFNGGDYTLDYDFNTACPNWPGANCSGYHPAINGVYTVTLAGGASASREFTLAVPPAVPTGVVADVTGQTQITVRWNRNTESDITSYDVFAGDGSLLAGALSPNTTSYVVNYPSQGYGGQHSFTVRASRAACRGCSQQIPSAQSGAASATLTEPTPTPTPSEDPSQTPDDGSGSPDPGQSGDPGSGSTTDPNGQPTDPAAGDPGTGSGGGGGTDPRNGGTGNTGTTSGSTNNNAGAPAAQLAARRNAAALAAKQRQLFASTFRSFAPKLGLPKLPPLPSFAPPTVAPEDQAFKPTLPYQPQSVQRSRATKPIAQFEDVVSKVFEGRRLWRSIAVSLLFLLLAAHMQLWLRTSARRYY